MRAASSRISSQNCILLFKNEVRIKILFNLGELRDQEIAGSYELQAYFV